MYIKNTLHCGKEKAEDILQESIMKFAGTFPQRTREIFLQSRIEGKTHAQIAEMLGITERSVENHLKNSVERFRKEFRS